MHLLLRAALLFSLSLPMITQPGSLSHAVENQNALPQETVQIIVTTNEVTINTNFTGTDLYIAGVLENGEPLVRLQNRYDIIITMEGPLRSMIMRKKKRRMGVWVNADSLTFSNVPLYYALASTRELRDITTPETYQHLGLGTANMPLHASTADKEKTALFREELMRLKKQQHLYSEHIGAVTFGSLSLFSTRFPIPTNVPVGSYNIYAYLFRDGAYIGEASARLEIMKEHFAYSIYQAAHRYSFWYGLAAVAIAILIGFTGRLLFRRD